MVERPHAGLVRFGVFEFDPASGELWKAGRRIRLQNQPRHVLKRLVSRPGELVTREELRRDLWPDDTFVDFDNGLNVAIRKLRDVFGDPAASPRFIETERAQGYRFIAPVSAALQPVPPQPAPAVEQAVASASPGSAVRSRRSVAIGLSAVVLIVGALVAVWLRRDDSVGKESLQATATSPPVSVAILPFRPSSGGDEFLAIGIPDGVITRLSNVRQFRVRIASTVDVDQRGASGAQDAGRALGSQYVVAGVVRTTADRVRVSVQLVRTSDGSSVWGRQYDVGRDDLLSVEDAIAERVAAALSVEVSEAERERLYRRYTRNGAAYERYLMGRARLRSLTAAGALHAIAEFEAATRLDPQYALAYAGVATAASQLRVRYSQPGESWDARARAEASRALQIDPDLAEGHEALAAVHRFQEYDWDTVIRESRRALELNPSSHTSHLYLAAAYFHLGLLEEATAEVMAARDLHPDSSVEALEILGAISLFDGRFTDAVAYLSQVHGPSDSLIVRYLLGWALFYGGEPAKAEALLDALNSGEGPLPGNARATLAAIRGARGATREARALADRVALEPGLIHHAAYGLGTAYAQLSDPERAIRWLSQAALTGFPCYPWYERDPLLDPIRGDARFSAFMQGLRESWESARAKYADRRAGP